MMLRLVLLFLAIVPQLRWPRTFHLKWPRWKHEEDSLQGIRWAARHGFAAIDLDLLITKDGIIVVCHWMHPLKRDNFFDPSGRVKVRDAVRQLTWDEISALRSKDHDHHYRIIKVERALAECARRKIKPALEPKNDARFETDWPWQFIMASAKAFGIARRVYVASIRNFPTKNAGVRRVEAAIRNGVPRNHTKILY